MTTTDVSTDAARLKIVAAGATDIGRGRKHNEDCVLVRPDLELYLLADGAGGHNAGNVASALATSSIANAYETSADFLSDRPDVDMFGLYTDARRLAAAIQKANQDILEIAKSSDRHKGMGTTIVAVAPSLASGALHVAHVGDSRGYRWRAGQLEQLTHDHSMINDILEKWPDLDDASLSRLPRHVVTRALGMEATVRVSVRTFELVGGDRYLLCSDGLSDALEPETISAIVGAATLPDDAVHALIDRANEAGAKDNIGVVVLFCDVVPGTLPPPRHRPARRRLASRVDFEPIGPQDPEIVILSVEDAPHVVASVGVNDEWLETIDDTLHGRSGPKSEKT